MLCVDTVQLLHTQRADRHIDWMIDLPPAGDEAPGLTTFRAAAAWPQWEQLGRVPLTELPPHRPDWLKRQGAVSGGRGRACRLGRGRAVVDGRHTHGWSVRLGWEDGSGFRAGSVAGRVTRLHQGRWEFVVGRRSGGPGSILRPRPAIAR